MKLPEGKVFCYHCNQPVTEEQYADHLAIFSAERKAREEMGGVYTWVDGQEVWAPTVEELRTQGFKVILRHFRYPQPDKPIMRSHLLRSIANGDLWSRGPRPNGGRTTVLLLAPDGHWAEGKAICSKKDTYSKRGGYVLAVNRALSALPDKE